MTDEITQDGPSTITIQYTTCRGCNHLVTKYWREELDNDEMDSGTDAHCTKIDKHVSSYWMRADHAPKWCPYITGENK